MNDGEIIRLESLRFSEFCSHCRKSLKAAKFNEEDTVYFVEKEVGRGFCSEQCITDYFEPVVSQLVADHTRLYSQYDFNADQIAELSHCQETTLGEPDEIWMEQTESSDRYYTFICAFDLNYVAPNSVGEGGSDISPKNASSSDNEAEDSVEEDSENEDRFSEQRFYYVVVCLAIDGVPSFIFLSFPTRDADLVEYYRRGTEVTLEQPAPDFAPEEDSLLEQNTDDDESLVSDQIMAAHLEEAAEASDILSDSENTAEENVENIEAKETPPITELNEEDEGDFYAKMKSLYKQGEHLKNVPEAVSKNFDQYVDFTMENPDEIWTFVDADKNTWYTFLTFHEGVHIIAVCKRGEKQSSVESLFGGLDLVFVIPTMDSKLADKFRKGINSLNKAFNNNSSPLAA